MRAWQVTRHGSPIKALELQEISEPVPSSGEILVRTSASVCNYNEVDCCHGRYLTVNPPLPYTLGMEFVGEVIDAGPGSEEWVGRRVVASARGAIGAHADVAVAPVAMAFEAPPTLTDAEAAALFFPFHLAYLGLHERGRLQPGETVLVHAAAGGVGSAAVQLAVAAGARVIATAGSPEKVQFVKELGADVAIDYRSCDFAEAVLEHTNNAGVDVCFDGVGGDVTMRSLQCLRRGGRHLVVGFANGIEAEEVPIVSGRVLCFGNFDIVGVILSYVDFGDLADAGVDITDFAPVPVPRFNPPPVELGRRVHAELLKLLQEGRIRPVVSRVVAFHELPLALEEMESRSTIGRVVITR
ncbi:MAG: NADPH:quinone oxidoreductase family protein [Acidimicrobiia bacterium]